MFRVVNFHTVSTVQRKTTVLYLKHFRSTRPGYPKKKIIFEKRNKNVNSRGTPGTYLAVPGDREKYEV